MSEPDLLLDIIQNPDLDEPRRAYASWAHAHGDPRGEFIDVQLALAELFRTRAPVAKWGPFFRQSEALIARHGSQWRASLADHQGVTDLRFFRGFVEHVSIVAQRYATEADRIYASAPIRHLTLTNVPQVVDSLASPSLARIVSLDVSNQSLDDDAIAVLASSRFSSRLRWLDISVNRITTRGLELIAASPHLKALQYLNAHGNLFEDPIERFGSEGEAIVFTEETQRGRELERAYGPLPWLHSPSVFGDAFPPNREAVVNP